MVDVPPQRGWAAHAFGAQVDALREAIPAALATAHTRARAGHDTAHATSRRIYGTALWEFQHEELVAAVAGIDGARVAKLGGYQLAVVNGHALFPLLYTDRAGIPVDKARLPLPVSEQRERLFGAHGVEVAHDHPFLDETWAELVPAHEREPFPQLGKDTQLVVIAYACSLEAGVLHVEWGRAEHRGGGELLWSEHEPLPLASAGSVTDAPAPSVGQDAGGHRFDTGEEPGIALGLRWPGASELNAPPDTEPRPAEPRVQGNERD
jgi:hypothetical protein